MYVRAHSKYMYEEESYLSLFLLRGKSTHAIIVNEDSVPGDTSSKTTLIEDVTRRFFRVSSGRCLDRTIVFVVNLRVDFGSAAEAAVVNLKDDDEAKESKGVRRFVLEMR